MEEGIRRRHLPGVALQTPRGKFFVPDPLLPNLVLYCNHV